MLFSKRTSNKYFQMTTTATKDNDVHQTSQSQRYPSPLLPGSAGTQGMFRESSWFHHLLRGTPSPPLVFGWSGLRRWALLSEGAKNFAELSSWVVLESPEDKTKIPMQSPVSSQATHPWSSLFPSLVVTLMGLPRAKEGFDKNKFKCALHACKPGSLKPP